MLYRTVPVWLGGCAERHDDHSGQPAAPAGAEVRRRDEGNHQGFRRVVAAACRAAQGRAERAAGPDRRLRLRHLEHLRRRDPKPDAGQARRQRIALYADAQRRTVLADARRDDQRAQPPLDGLRHHRRGRHRISRATTPSSPRTGRPSGRSSGTTVTRPRGSARTTTRRRGSRPRLGRSTSGPRATASSTSTASPRARPTSGPRTSSATTRRSSRGGASPRARGT